MFVLADTSYGSTCIDEIAAQHVNADCLIHFGQFTLVPSDHLPVLCVFGRELVDCSDCVLKFRLLFPDLLSHVLLITNVTYYHAQESIASQLIADYPNLVLSVIDEAVLDTGKSTAVLDDSKNNIVTQQAVELQSDETHDKVGNSSAQGYWCQNLFGRKFQLAEGRLLSDYCIFFIGHEGAVLNNFMMCLNKCQFYSYNPVSFIGQQESPNINRSLMQRYYFIQKVKDAKVIGIIVGTLALGNILAIIERLSRVIKNAGKKSYLFVVGKLNPAKLANFMEIDVFVLVAAPESSLLDLQEFYQPVVTPYELEMACIRCRQWTGEFITDYRELLPGGASHVSIDCQADEDIKPEYSFITGSLKSMAVTKNILDDESQALVERDPMEVATMKSTAQFLNSKVWKGLEQRLGDTPLSSAVEGRKGIAIAYEDEPQT
ncbi:2-(3-amino-3-carboxypropyl)histidine synthase subunit 2-like isoform X2 [Corticium candelabrum]|uniref:2-(3-amino-3-carboxypropyl)histidine synthase subunit 2-like isoform X2 n=1 Tax=Corticium candelabrum TaxID=121492 RepID=UPI002E26E152|nr:2-(3-amino-3-carboxypropyl)histidine synthase subunit 2-like isoform X2 [Corticium candelabrum]